MKSHHAKRGGTGHAAGHGWRPISDRQAARCGQRLGQRGQPLACPARMIVLKAGLILIYSHVQKDPTAGKQQASTKISPRPKAPETKRLSEGSRQAE